MTLLLSIWCMIGNTKAMGYITVTSCCLSDTKDYSKSSQIIMFMEIVSNSASAKNCLITKLSRACEPSKQFLIPVWRQQDFWVQLGWKQIEEVGRKIVHNVAQMTKDIFTFENAKHTTIEEAKQWNNMTSVSEDRRHGPLLRSRFLYTYFKNSKKLNVHDSSKRTK